MTGLTGKPGDATENVGISQGVRSRGNRSQGLRHGKSLEAEMQPGAEPWATEEVGQREDYV